MRLRTDAGKRYKKVASAAALIWGLLMVAERHFRRLGHTKLLPLVAASVRFCNGERVRDQDINHDQRAVA